jgi:hypothetical protein
MAIGVLASSSLDPGRAERAAPRISDVLPVQVLSRRFQEATQADPILEANSLCDLPMSRLDAPDDIGDLAVLLA